MRPTLPGKSSPKSHRSRPFPGNSGQGQNYRLQTRQSACPGRRESNFKLWEILITRRRRFCKRFHKLRRQKNLPQATFFVLFPMAVPNYVIF